MAITIGPRRRWPMPLAMHEDGPLRVAAATRKLAVIDEPTSTFVHERVLVDIEAVGWLVFDRLVPNNHQPHVWEWLWHLPADRVTIADDGQASAAYENEVHLQIHSAGNTTADVAEVGGRLEPTMRGWRQPRDEMVKLPTLSLCTPAHVGAVWRCTLLAPSPARPKGPPLQFAAADGENAWLIHVDGPAGSMTLRLTGAAEVESLALEAQGRTVAKVELDQHREASWRLNVEE